eukprot:7379162-Alexandrium_andersonii.AAC.1
MANGREVLDESAGDCPEDFAVPGCASPRETRDSFDKFDRLANVSHIWLLSACHEEPCTR